MKNGLNQQKHVFLGRLKGQNYCVKGESNLGSLFVIGKAIHKASYQWNMTWGQRTELQFPSNACMGVIFFLVKNVI